MTESIREIFSKNLKRIRKQKGMTQKDLAERLNVFPTAYHRWESGEFLPQEDSISKIAQVLEISETLLFFDESLVTPEVASQILFDHFNKQLSKK